MMLNKAIISPTPMTRQRVFFWAVHERSVGEFLPRPPYTGISPDFRCFFLYLGILIGNQKHFFRAPFFGGALKICRILMDFQQSTLEIRKNSVRIYNI